MKPDDRKGKLRVCKATDGLNHLQWGGRAPDMPFLPEDDFIIFPQEAEMKFIPKPGVFVIKFPDDPSRNMFFWSQEPAGKIADDELVSDVNAALNGNRPSEGGRGPIASRAAAIRQAQAAAASALATAGPGAVPDETPAPTASVAATPAAPAKADAPPAPPASVVSSSALQAALGNLGAPQGASPAGAQGAPAGGMDHAAMAAMLAGMQARGVGQRARGPGLSDVLTPDAVGPLLRSEDVRARLLEHLPEEHRGTQDLEELLRTPQFQNQLERFSAALQSGQMDLAQFGLSPGSGFSVAEFLSAIQQQAESEEAKEGGGDDAMKE